MSEKNRRAFLKEASVYGGGLALAGLAAGRAIAPALAAQAAGSAAVPSRIGLGLYTVRDLMTDAAGYRAVLAKVAALGYTEVEPADRTDTAIAYAGLDPKAFRALLDANGLAMPSTHSSAIDGPGLESQLEGFQTMGIQYTEVIAPTSAHAAPPRPAARPTVPPAARRGPARGVATTAPIPARTLDQVKRTVDGINAHARITQKFGIKILVRMDIDVYAPLSDHPEMMPYQVIADNTDPALVTMQIDLGWAAVSGQDIVGMFQRNSGHYELWHVKDAVGLNAMTPAMSLADRRRVSYFVPAGLGQVNLRAIFAGASVAGLKHFAVEQDNAAAWGDSLAAARISYANLRRLLA